MLFSKSELRCASECKKVSKSIYALLGLCCVGIHWSLLAVETGRTRFYDTGFDIHFSGLFFQANLANYLFYFSEAVYNNVKLKEPYVKYRFLMF